MKYVLILSLICAFFISCEKKEKRLQITDPQLIEALNMQVGSYFIYQDSVTEIIDSLYVRYYTHSYASNDRFNELYEEVAVSFSDGKSPTKFSFSLQCGGGRYLMNKIRLLTSYNYPDEGFLDAILYASPPASADPYVLEGKLDSLSVDGNSYSDIYVFRFDGSNGTVRSFFSLNKGLVKFATTTDIEHHVWSLKRSHILRR